MAAPVDTHVPPTGVTAESSTVAEENDECELRTLAALSAAATQLHPTPTTSVATTVDAAVRRTRGARRRRPSGVSVRLVCIVSLSLRVRRARLCGGPWRRPADGADPKAHGAPREDRGRRGAVRYWVIDQVNGIVAVSP